MFVYVVTLVRAFNIIRASVLTQTRGVVPSHHCSGPLRQSAHLFTAVQPTALHRCPLFGIQYRRLGRPFYMQPLSVPSLVTKAHRPAFVQSGDICATISGM